MESKMRLFQQDLPFPVPPYRFDQKNEMFKRPFWDGKMEPLGKRFYQEAKYQDTPGYRKLDYAFRFGAWNLEFGAAFGNSRSNFGLYAWNGVPPKIEHWVKAGGQVKESRQEMTSIIKRVGRFYGADLVGICRLHQNWVYSHEYNTITQTHYPIEIPPGCDNVIVMAIAMDYDAMRTSPCAIEGAATGLGYSQMAFITNLMAVFIRNLGYKAIPCGNDTALSIPLAMAAGLGEAGRHGLLITEKFGPRVRLCKIFTDLPLVYDSYQRFGVTEFCRVCKKCATYCPSRAIPFGDMTEEGYNISNHSGTLKWYSNYEKCFHFWSKNRNDCANCIRVCAFNKPAGRLHDFTRWHIKHIPWLDRIIVKLDDFLGYGEHKKPEKYWH
jgi:reductive dehalogenase